MSKKTDTTVGVDTEGNAILRTPKEMLGWLGQVGTVWSNDTSRANTRGAYAGQLGVQTDNWTIYIARSTEPGAWVPFLKEDGLVLSTGGVPTAEAKPAVDIVGTTQTQTLSNKTIINSTITDPSGLDANDVGLGNVNNSPDSAKPISGPMAAALAEKQNISVQGIALGYPNLDSQGKVPLSQIPDSVVGANPSKERGTRRPTRRRFPRPLQRIAAGITRFQWQERPT
jgi:hypothetical protein